MTTRSKARVLVDVSADDGLKLCVRNIRIVSDEITLDGFEFEWFSMRGNSPDDARRNCIDSIAFFVRCRPELHAAIVGALDVSCANDVVKAIEAKS